MNDSLWVAIVNGLVLIALAWMDRRADRRAKTTQTQIEQVVHHTNSMKDELVAEVRKSAHAEGVIEGQQDPSAGK